MALIGKLIRDASTLKLMRDSVTKKLMRRYSIVAIATQVASGSRGYLLDYDCNVICALTGGYNFMGLGIRIAAAGVYTAGWRSPDPAISVLKSSFSCTPQADYDTGNRTHDVDVGPLGNVYVVGYRQDNKSLWKLDGDLSSELDNYDTGDSTYGVAVDGGGNVYIAGNSSVINQYSVWKLDSNGNLVWKRWTGNWTRCIAVDSSGNVYAGGYQVGSPYKSVWKYNSDGDLIWSAYPCTTVYGIAVDGSGNVYIAGARTGEKSVWKLNSSGALQWDYDTGSHALSIKIGHDGSVWIAGYAGTPNNSIMWKLDSDGDFVCSAISGSGAIGYAVDIM